MSKQLKFEIRRILKIGNSCAITLPREYLAHLSLLPSDKVYVRVSGDCIILEKFMFKETNTK